MADLNEFANSMRNMAARIERRAPILTRRIAGEILRLVILGTPVGNTTIWREPNKAPAGYVGGRARANWFVGLGSAPSDVTDSTDGNSAIIQGEAVISGHATGSIYLTNNLPYIVALNEGHSHQAPSGYIDTAVIAGAASQQNYKLTEDTP